MRQLRTDTSGTFQLGRNLFICWPFAGYLLHSLSKEIKSSILSPKCMFYACFSLIFICCPFAGYLLPSLSKEIKSSILSLKCMFYACFSLIFICWPFAGYLLHSLSKEIKSSILGLKCMFCARFSPVFICWPFANYGIPLNIINGFAFSTKDSDLSNKLIPHRDIISIFSLPLMFIQDK